MDTLPDTETMTTVEQSETPEDDEDALDPRVQIELERLNHANEAINQLELQLDEARKSLRAFIDTSEEDLSRLEKTIGASVGKARRYYDARIECRDAKDALTKAKHRFERAQALHVAAKEIAIVSADYIDEAARSNEVTTLWSDTYGQAIAKAADSEREKYQADLEQQRVEQTYSDLEKLVEKLAKDYRRTINRSKPYYDMKAEYHKELDFQKRKVFGLESCVAEAKSQYQESLRNLERISNEIHAQRKAAKMRRELGERTAGVGEEQLSYVEFEPLPPSPVRATPSPPPIVSPYRRAQRPDNLLRSCLLRTETLPAGIFATTNDRHSPEGDETTPTASSFNNQFTLSAPSPPSLIVIDHHHQPTYRTLENSYERKLSEGASSQTTIDDDDDRTDSLHALNDEQLEHLSYGYRQYAPPSQETDTIDELLSHLQNSKLQAKTFFRNLFKTGGLSKQT